MGSRKREREKEREKERWMREWQDYYLEASTRQCSTCPLLRAVPVFFGGKIGDGLSMPPNVAPVGAPPRGGQVPPGMPPGVPPGMPPGARPGMGPGMGMGGMAPGPGGGGLSPGVLGALSALTGGGGSEGGGMDFGPILKVVLERLARPRAPQAQVQQPVKPQWPADLEAEARATAEAATATADGAGDEDGFNDGDETDEDDDEDRS